MGSGVGVLGALLFLLVNSTEDTQLLLQIRGREPEAPKDLGEGKPQGLEETQDGAGYRGPAPVEVELSPSLGSLESFSYICWLTMRMDAVVGGAQELATGESSEAEIDFKYAIIGTALGFAISAGFLALKICMIRKQLFDNDSSDLVYNDTTGRKKRNPRDDRVIEL